RLARATLSTRRSRRSRAAIRRSCAALIRSTIACENFRSMWAKVDRFRRFGEAESQLVRPDGLAGRVFQSDATRSNFAGGPVTHCDFDPCVGEFAAVPTSPQNRRDENEEIFVNLESSQDF